MDIHLPREWDEAARQICRDRPHLVLVIGETDTGKSTFIRHLLRVLLNSGISCSLVDADIGQKDLGPPATVTLGEFRYLYELRLAVPRAMYFVGSTSPRGHLLPLLVGTKLMAEKAEGQVVVVNTTGFVRNAGFALKGFKIELLSPELIVALQREAELEPLLEAYSHMQCARLPVSEMAEPKSFDERRALRREAFRRYFASSRMRRLKVEELRFQRAGSEMGDEGMRDLMKPHLLVGLADPEGETLGLGIIKGFNAGEVRMLTPVRGKVAVLQFSRMLLREDGKELGFVRW